jgi:hypothetical protein
MKVGVGVEGNQSMVGVGVVVCVNVAVGGRVWVGTRRSHPVIIIMLISKKMGMKNLLTGKFPALFFIIKP